MSMSRSLAYHVAPIWLRLVLGLTFLWAGIGKVATFTTFPPEQVQLLLDNNYIKDATPDAARVRRVHGITLALLNAGPKTNDTQPTPVLDASDAPTETIPETGFEDIEGVTVERRDAETGAGVAPPAGMALAPAFATRGIVPGLLAWTAAITEILAALLVLVGLLTRLGALTLLGVIGVAAWLTQIGPAIASGDANLGFLPAGNLWDPKTVSVFLWQLAIAAACLALCFSGSGALALDRAALGRKAGPSKHTDDDEDDE